MKLSAPLMLLTAASLLAGPAHAAQSDSDAQLAKLYFQSSAMSSAMLSPDGATLAVTMRNANGRQQLITMDPDQPASAKVAASFDDADITGVEWLGGSKLLFSVFDSQRGSGEQFGHGLYVVDKNGEHFKQLISPQWNIVSAGTHLANRTLTPAFFLLGRLPNNDKEILLGEYKGDNIGELKEVGLHRLNIETQHKVSLTFKAPDYTTGWITDKSNGEPLIAVSSRNGRYKVYRRADADSAWQLWQDVDHTSAAAWTPQLLFNGQLYASTVGPSGYSSLYQIDPATRQPSKSPIVSTPGFDAQASPLFDESQHQLLGWRFETDALGTYWTQADMAAAQAKIDAQLSDTVNLIYCQSCLSAKRWTVVSFSDRAPGTYWLYDRASNKLTPIGHAKPKIDPAKMAATEFDHYTARDGLSIPVYITRPQGSDKAPRPAVLMIHGGPYVRGGHWGWEPMRQYLASLGYTVIEPEYRGSTGYGDKLFRAGWKEWGLKMQDDMQDAVRWAAERKLIDPKRVCIAGASYGGYAALMGPIRHPDTYRCAISWVGVTDIELIETSTLSDSDEQFLKYGFKKLVADLPAERKKIEDTSPVYQADRFKVPLLIAYGSDDRRVPIEHGNRWRKAAEKAGVDMDWVVYSGEGHGWMKEENNIDFALRIKRLLDRTLGAN
ncbi:S9 family peptidase [Chromobacterium sp. IIBBL 290-4]|uniref:alpha/beta hydrolase family protein n=1 Tax=Chromobacterium sp. IIBBL 290-4 TaxID=2953890 RepID=UPI0020B6D5B5|nr:alpha/beta fold hydrolase [Chromobacterium sp. IIBBL 290-4]UTH75526.1 alpha/beta fold hydrolase [Chromobacterium sp. IIBBL 290-4]